MTRLAVAIAFLGLNFYIYNFMATQGVIPERSEFEEFPLELGEWACAEPQEMTEKVRRNLGVSDYFICNFRRQDPNAVVSLYVGYHATQVREEGGGAGENAIHPPAHCLPGAGWDVISSQVVRLDAPGLPQSPALVKRLVIAKGDFRSIVYYWYQSRGRIIAEDWKKILYLVWDRAVQGRTDGSLVRFTVPVDRDEDRADDAFLNLAPRVLAHLSAFVPG